MYNETNGQSGSGYSNNGYERFYENSQSAGQSTGGYSTGGYSGGSYSGGSYNSKPPKKKSGVGKVVLFALLFGLISGTVFSGVNYISGLLYHVNKVVETVPNTPEPAANVDLPASSGTNVDTSNTQIVAMDVSSVVEAVMPSVVSITNISVNEYVDFFGRRGQQTSKGAGSGFIVHQSDSEVLIATNYHVVKEASKLTVGFCDGMGAEAVVKETDPDNDVAIVSVSVTDVSPSTLEAIRISKLGDSSKLKAGETAIVVGNALGYGQSVTAGVISALERTMTNEDGATYSVIQTDAEINPGNSGGVLLNARGEVVGISNAKSIANYTNSICYAVPMANALPTIEKAINGASVAVDHGGPEGAGVKLGISGVNVGSEEQARYHIPMGAYIAKVEAGTPAEKAGLQEEDVIVKIDDEKISTVEDVQKVCKKHKAGDTVTVEVYRFKDGLYAKESVEVTF